jgi:hypothetical protein
VGLLDRFKRAPRMYRMAAPSVLWGDYGRALREGIAWNLPRVDGALQLERTGPSIAPITFPSGDDIVVITAAVRSALESSGLRGCVFRPVIKARVVNLDWQSWPAADHPALYPAGGEPDRYILGRKNNPAAADALGELWELYGQQTAPSIPGNPPCLDVGELTSDFLVSDERPAGVFVSTAAKDWIAAAFPGACNFQACG